MNVILDWDKKSKKVALQTTPEILNLTREKFSQVNENYTFEKKRNPFAAPRKYIISNTGKFKIGLLSYVINYINTLNFPIELTLTELLKSLLKTIIKYKNCNFLQELNLALRYYQYDSVLNCITKGNGIIELGTAGGKTLIMASYIHNLSLIHNNPLKFLILTPLIQLVEQIPKDFIKYGINENLISKWGGGNKLDKDKSIIISSFNSITRNYKNIEWLKDINVVLIDEVHYLKKDNKLNKVVDSIHTFNKVGFTGTLPPEYIDKMNIIGQTGPVIYHMGAKQLRQENFITSAKIVNIFIHYKKPPFFAPNALNPTEAYNNEKDFLYKNIFRNNIITNLAKNCKQNILILVNNIEYGNLLYETIKQNTNKDVYYIHGEVKLKKRIEICEHIENTNNNIIIAMASIFSVGISINNIHYIIFTLGGVSFVRIAQSIGRGSRLLENKNQLVIFDITDNTDYSMDQFNERIKIYKEEDLKLEEKHIYEK